VRFFSLSYCFINFVCDLIIRLKIEIYTIRYEWGMDEIRVGTADLGFFFLFQLYGLKSLLAVCG